MKRTIDKRYENRDLPVYGSSLPLWFKGGVFLGALAWVGGVIFSIWVILSILEILRNWN